MSRRQVTIATGEKVDESKLAHIIPALRPLAVPLGLLTRDPRNARQHGDRNLAAVRASLLRYGQRLPVVVQKEGMVVRAGNGRHESAQALGWEYIAAVVVDEPTPEAIGYALVDNRSAELATWRFDVLGDLVAELRESAAETLPDLGWSEQELESLTLAQGWDDTPPPSSNGDGEDDGTGVTLPPSSIRFTSEQRAKVDDACRVAASVGAPATTPGETIAWVCEQWAAARLAMKAAS